MNNQNDSKQETREPIEQPLSEKEMDGVAAGFGSGGGAGRAINFTREETSFSWGAKVVSQDFH
jgi:hypothetical protein